MGVSGQCSRHGFAAGWGGWGVVSVRAWVPSRNGEGWGGGGFPPPAAWHRVRVPSHPSRRKGRALRNTCHGELPWAREAMEKYGFFTKKRERERPATYHAPRHHLAALPRPPRFQPEPSRSPKWDRSGPWRRWARGCESWDSPRLQPRTLGNPCSEREWCRWSDRPVHSPVAGALWQRRGGVSAGRLLPRRAPHPRGAPQGPLPVCSGPAAWSGRGSGA